MGERSRRAGRAASGIAVLIVLLGASACAPRSQEIRNAQKDYRLGRMTGAADTASSVRDRCDGDDGQAECPQILYALYEEGVLMHEAGRWDESKRALFRADNLTFRDSFFLRFNLGEEIWAAIDQIENVKYHAAGHERVLGTMYLGLAHLWAGDIEGARNGFARTMERHTGLISQYVDWSRLYEVSLETARGEAEARIGVFPYEAIEEEAGFASHRRLLESYDPYENWSVPIADWLAAVFYVGAARDAASEGEADRARTLLRRVVRAVPSSAFARAELDVVESINAGQPRPARTFVLFATGVAPYRTQERIEVELPLADESIREFTFAVPLLHFDEDEVDSLRIEAGGEVFTPETITDMDRVVATAFRRELPFILTRTAINTSVRLLIRYAADQATEEIVKQAGDEEEKDETAQMMQDLVNSFGQMWQHYTANTDLRSVASLPQSYRIASFPTPADGVVRLAGDDLAPTTLRVESEGYTLIYYRSLAPGFTPLVRVVNLSTGRVDATGSTFIGASDRPRGGVGVERGDEPVLAGLVPNP